MANLSSYFGSSLGSGESRYVRDPRKLPIQVCRPYVKDWTNAHEYIGAENFWFHSIPTYLQMYNDEWRIRLADPSTDPATERWNNPNPTQTGITGSYYKAVQEEDILGGWIYYTNDDANAYKTVCNLSGKPGILTNVIGPGNLGQPAGTKTYIKITVDGAEYEFKSFLSYYNDNANTDYERLFWGHSVLGNNNTGSPHSGGPWAGNYGDYGTGRQNRSRFMMFDKDTMVLNNTEQTMTIVNPYHFDLYMGFVGLRFDNSIKVEVKNEPVAGAVQSTTGYSHIACALVKYDTVIPGY